MVAPFDGVNATARRTGDDVAGSLARELEASLGAIRLEQAPRLDFTVATAGKNQRVEGDNAVDRSVHAAELATKTNADAVVYGRIGAANGFVTVDAYIYLPADRLVHAEELGGEQVLGHLSGGRADLGLDDATRQQTRLLVGEQAQGLGSFLTALAAYRARDLPLARRWFTVARSSAGWPSVTGRALAELFSGNTYGKLHLDAAAAKAYENASGLIPNWSRARIGLAEVALHRALEGCGPSVSRSALAEARELFAAAIEPGADLVHTAVRIRATLGEARADVCAAAVDPTAAGRAPAELRATLAAIGRQTSRFGAEAAEANAALGLLALPDHDDVGTAPALREALDRYLQAMRLTDDPERAQLFQHMVHAIEDRLRRINP